MSRAETMFTMRSLPPPTISEASMHSSMSLASRAARPADAVTDEVWSYALDVNARGTMYTNQAAFPHLRVGGGGIVNFASSTGVHGMVDGGHYAASKGAVLAWARSIAKEWGRHGIRANAVTPVISTPMYKTYRARLAPEALAEHDAEIARRIPLGGKFGDPDIDMAPVIVFLVSDASRFITGQTLAVDGGWLIP